MTEHPTGERLSFDDAEILRLETDAIKGHTMKVLVAEPRCDGSALELDELRAAVERRLAREPRARQRVAFPPLRIGPPVWADDPQFDIRYHVADATTERPVDRSGLLAIAEGLFAERLDHRRPLWRCDVVPMEQERTGLVLRIHHCLADGITSLRFGSALLWDARPEATFSLAQGWAPRPQPDELDLALDAVRGHLRRAPEIAAGIARVATDPSRWPALVREAADTGATIARELAPEDPGPSPLDRHIGPRRQIAVARLSLDELKGVAHLGSAKVGRHVTLNDVLLAVVAAGLRDWMSQKGDDTRRMRVQVPVSLHGRDDDDSLGNRDSFIDVDLPLELADPLMRLRRINAETVAKKSAGDPEALYTFFHALSRFRPLYEGVTRFASRPSEFGLSVSNVPGPPADVYVLGGRVAELFSTAEPADRHALRLSAISYGGGMQISLACDPEAITDVASLAGAMEDAVPELALAVA